ncbi:endoglucanase B [Plectosphaerella plurivora]|uniref:lytic cellulose monooxygenase (C4-dehydrogenating) n=1 Tax=Plectosphaerella plurivora TaxID=936078 RepID=A0A9P8V1W6_9PEZI|nr:endoglucanase B [Plectosphaerella plurivora]
MKFTTAMAAFLATTSLIRAHTLMVGVHINGKSQGDGTCVRMPIDSATSTSPVKGLTSKDMACGKDGEIPAAYVCPVSAGATLTFEYREWPDGRQGGAIDKSHRGPCSIWVKRVDDMFSDPAAGGGWTKIWHEGYDADAGRWCTEKLMDNKGLLSFELSSGLPKGDYLVRSELLALHQAASKDDPQYYVGCVQLHIRDGPSDDSVLSRHAVRIPGHVDGSEPGNKFDIYKRPMDQNYEIPGPEPYSPTGRPSGKPDGASDFPGAIPDDCLVKNANWCGEPLPPYSGELPCWAAVEACFARGSKCYDSTSPTGVKGCDNWNKYMCHGIQAECRAKNFKGPPEVEIPVHSVDLKGPIPSAVNKGAGSLSDSGGRSNIESDDSSAKKPAVTTPATSSPSTTRPSKNDEDDSGVVTSPVFEVFTSTSSSGPRTSASPALETGSDTGSDESGSGSKPDTDLTISPDGSCGGDSGYTCLGSRFGNCCSRFGRCGRRTRACSCHCQSAFGLCNDKTEKD